MRVFSRSSLALALATVAVICFALSPSLVFANDLNTVLHAGATLLPAAGALAGISSAAIRRLQAASADAVKQAREITDGAAKANRDMNEEEQKRFDDLMAQVDRNNASIQREQRLLASEAHLGVLDVPGARHISVEENIEKDPKRGFSHKGEFYMAVVKASVGRGVDKRLVFEPAGVTDRQAAAPTTFSNEAAGADGGFAIPPDFSRELWRLSLGEGSLLPKTANTEISGNSMFFPKDESTPWGGTGVQVYWQAEAAAAQQSKPQIGMNAMVLHKLLGLVPVTNELVEDGFAIGSYLTPLLSDRITWKTNEAILFGTGAGQPLGCLTNAGNTGSPAIVQAKESGQSTGTLDAKNVTKMVQRLLVGELGSAFWLATPDILTPLEALTVGQYPVYLPNNGLSESPYGMLKGRPLMLSEHAAAFSSQSDLSLLSLRGYRTITKAAGVQTDTSMHLFFDADAMAMRVRFRMNGAPIMSAPVTPPKSSNTRSHFVTLQAR